MAQYSAPILPRRAMPQTQREFLLVDLLKSVSRSFYLTLRVLPVGVREPIGLAYLLARTADSIADTPLLPPEQRIGLLLGLAGQISAPDQAAALAPIVVSEQAFTNSKERVLLAQIPQMLALLQLQPAADKARIQHVVATLCSGMQFDLTYFPDERTGALAALPDLAALDHYTWQVAGCVGEFWTELTHAHLRALRHWPLAEMSRLGIAFGRALQMTNVLRDCAADLRIGRCYLPQDLLLAHGLSPAGLLHADASMAARPLLFELVRHALAQYADATRYLLAIPRRCVRLRLACLWPILIGLETLLALVQNPAWLDPAQVSKIRRQDIYRLVRGSVLIVAANSALQRRVSQLTAQIHTAMADAPAS